MSIEKRAPGKSPAEARAIALIAALSTEYHVHAHIVHVSSGEGLDAVADARARGFLPSDVARWMSRRPARLCGLGDRKGALQVGHDADVVLWNPDARCDVDSRLLQQRHKLTPYGGRTLRGMVSATSLRGERIWDGHGLTASGRGRLL